MKTKKAFTLIEVIIVIVVLGALVLMATANNKSALKDAQLTQIKADTATIETNNKKNTLLGNSAINEKATRTKEDLDKKIKELDAKVYNKKGLVADLPQDEYFTTTYTENSTNGKLQGSFVIGKTNKSAYYIDKSLGLEILEAKAEDELFRRFVSIKGTLSELPPDRKITVELGDVKGDPNNRKFEFNIETPKFEIINKIPRFEDKEDKCWLILNDGSKNIIKEFDYPKTYQLELSASQYRKGRRFIKVSTDRDNTDLTIDIVDKNGNHVTTIKKFLKHKNTKEIVELTKDGNKYLLQSGDKMIFKGEATEDEKTYTSNPWILDIY